MLVLIHIRIKMQNSFGFDDDDFMPKSPKESFFSIAKTANQNIVENEIQKMFQRLAVAEMLLAQEDRVDEIDALIPQLSVSGKLDELTNDIYLELMGNIVTQCE